MLGSWRSRRAQACPWVPSPLPPLKNSGAVQANSLHHGGIEAAAQHTLAQMVHWVGLVVRGESVVGSWSSRTAERRRPAASGPEWSTRSAWGSPDPRWLVPGAREIQVSESGGAPRPAAQKGELSRTGVRQESVLASWSSPLEPRGAPGCFPPSLL